MCYNEIIKIRKTLDKEIVLWYNEIMNKSKEVPYLNMDDFTSRQVHILDNVGKGSSFKFRVNCTPRPLQ